ncbi:MAG: OsmC family protein [Myxococcaceae bacterium]
MAMTITFPGGKRVDATVGGFTIQTDQPVASGGEASAPEPFTLFLASIGTCAGIYVLGFCQTRGIPTQGMRLTQVEEYDKETRRLSRVRIEIELPPDFPEKYRDAVKNAAENCKVKKAILSPPAFDIETVVTGAV